MRCFTFMLLLTACTTLAALPPDFPVDVTTQSGEMPLSVLTLAEAIALVCIGLLTVTDLTCGPKRCTTAQVLVVAPPGK